MGRKRYVLTAISLSAAVLSNVLRANPPQPGEGTPTTSTTEPHNTPSPATISDKDSIAAEVKTDSDAIQPIKDEISLHEKEAADAEALAKIPPPNIPEDGKSAYIDGKKNEAQTAHDAVKDATERLSEAQKSLVDAKARLLAAQGKV